MNIQPQTLPIETTDSSTPIEPIQLYKVVFLNDDFTTFAFVISLLMTLFDKDYSTAVKLTTEVHHNGSSHVATFPKELAELRQAQVHQAAKREGFPFRCIVEPF